MVPVGMGFRRGLYRFPLAQAPGDFEGAALADADADQLARPIP